MTQFARTIRDMSKSACERCGYECSSARVRWWDRHPIAAVFIALPTMFTIISIIVAYPWFCIPLIVVAAAAWLNQRQRQRSAVAARAEYEYRELMVAAVRGVPIYSLSGSRRGRPRGADHWSPTQPIKH